MWRSSSTVPGAMLAPVLIAVAFVVADPLAAAEPSATGAASEEGSDEFEAAEAAAVSALDFDPWMIGEQALVEARVPIDTNLVTQRSGLGSAESRLELAIVELDEAIDRRVEHEGALEELETLLQAYAIGTFVSSDPVYDPNPNAQVLANRRQAPLSAITEDTLDDVQRARESLQTSIGVEDTARATRLELNDELIRRGEAVDRAENLVDDYEQIVVDRAEEIEVRTGEALALNEVPDLGEVRGIRVNVDLVPLLEDLLAAAEADGIILSGWGHRPVDRQIVLRVAHCGDSGHAIFDLPAASCSPPTAKPGYSQHELGLAVDFTENGRVLTAASPGFKWLVENAAEFGLINLPSEPWHWSTTGH